MMLNLIKLYILYSLTSESEGQVAAGCPKSILDKLSPTNNENALEWRKIAGMINTIADKLNITPSDKNKWELVWNFVHSIVFQIKDDFFPSMVINVENPQSANIAAAIAQYD